MLFLLANYSLHRPDLVMTDETKPMFTRAPSPVSHDRISKRLVSPLNSFIGVIAVLLRALSADHMRILIEEHIH